MLGPRGAWPAAAILAVSVGLSACSVPDWANPVEWYRDATGVAKDDPSPATRNSQNLAKGSKQPYPNLASVPPPPTNALSSAEREKLRNSLAADRANAKYVDSNDPYVAAPPKVVPGPPLNAPEPAQAASAPSAPVQAAQAPPPRSPAGSAASQRGAEAPPQESSLTPPSVRSVPQGETPRPPPPPPPGVPARAQPQPVQPTAPPPQPPQQQTATLPPPSVPAPSPGPAVDPAFAGGVGVTLGTIQFAGNNAKLSPDILAQVRDVAALRQQNGGGTIRVTGYSEPQGDQDTMAPQLESFNLALDRARAVAAALAQNGVPVRAVEIGASPPPPGQSGGVVEISLER